MKSREAKANSDTETTERVRAWSKAKDKEKADITRLSDDAREKSEAETRSRKKSNSARRLVE